VLTLRQIIEGLSRWIDAVAGAIVGAIERVVTRRTVKLREDEHGALTLEGADGGSEPLRIVEGRVDGAVSRRMAAALRGGRVEVVMQPHRFMFRPLELPARAAEFLDGVVRAQIDRLTPWSAADAVFGWTQPTQAGPERIGITIAASARALVAPVAQALTDAGAASVAVSTFWNSGEAGPHPITVFAESGRRGLEIVRVRRAVAVILLIATLAAAGAVGSLAAFGPGLSNRQDELARRIAERRAAMLGGREASLDGAAGAERALERRKHQSPIAVMVLEALSQILPDHTYVTELRIEGDKLRVIGLTRDAPSLIGLMEQSSQFTRATFFAPTTRSPNEPGERFHIEARIEPYVPRS